MGVLPDEEALMLMVCGGLLDRKGGKGCEGQPRGRGIDGGRRSVKWVESGNGDFKLSLCDRTRASSSHPIPLQAPSNSTVTKNTFLV